jgi:uncharacterized protein (UPF0248 family)
MSSAPINVNEEKRREAKKKKKSKRQSSRNDEPKQKQKLRSSKDVFHRITWDDGMDANDYAIGYVDRFKGELEVLVSEWCQDELDVENHIPYHRVAYFRRISDDVKVWDRKEKIDLIFPSSP